MRVPPILRSRVAPFAALYGAAPGLVARWADAPGMEAAMVAWFIGALTVVPMLFGYLIVREARAPTILYPVLAPMYVVALALAAFTVSVIRSVADAWTLLAVFVFIGPWLASLAIGGGMFGGGRRAGAAQPLTLKS